MERLQYKNPELQKLIQELRKTSVESSAPIWKRIAEDLEKPCRNQRIINLSKISKVANEGDTIVVPGKVLGGGILDKKLTIAAQTFSGDALAKIKESKSLSMSLYEIMKKNPEGKKVRVLG